MRKLQILLVLIPLLFLSCGRNREDFQYENLIPFAEDVEVVTDTRLIDFGNPASHFYLHSGWSKDQKERDDVTFAILESRKGSVFFHCLTIAEKLLKIRCRATGNRPLFLIPVVNQERLKPQKIEAQFAEYSWNVSPGSLVSGRNELSLVIRDAEQFEDRIAIDTIRITEKGQDVSPREERIFTTKIENGIDKIGSIGAPVPSSLSTYFKVPSHGQLEIRYGIVREGFFKTSNAEFSIYLEDQKGNPEKLHSERIVRNIFLSGTGALTIPAARFANQIVRITLEAFPLEGKAAPRKVYWQGAIALEKTIEKTSPSPGKANIFFYLMDAARADHLQPYGYPQPTSPRILEFSKNSVLFENAYSHASWTRPAVASILTGLYPSAHRAIDRIDLLPESVPTLQRILKAHGYRNYCFSAQPNVGPTFRFERDFDVFKLITKDEKRQAQSDRVYKELETFLSQQTPKDAFFYIHVIDTHRPYLPLEQFQNVFGNCRATEEDLNREDKIACAREQYDSLVLQSDFYFGKFLDLLKTKNLYDDSLIILTADHGESFWEHNEMGHGKSLYEPEIRVPLIIHFPKGKHSGKRVQTRARHIDLFSTMLEHGGVPAQPGTDSFSLLSLIDAPKETERFVFSELSLDNERAKSLIAGEYKIIYKGGDKPGYELFHLKNDPLEKKNISQQEPIVFGYMKQILNKWTREQIKKGEAHKSEKAVLDKETEEMLKGLGYLQ